MSPSGGNSHLSINRPCDLWHGVLKRRQYENLYQTFCETIKFNTCITTGGKFNIQDVPKR